MGVYCIAQKEKDDLEKYEDCVVICAMDWYNLKKKNDKFELLDQ